MTASAAPKSPAMAAASPLSEKLMHGDVLAPTCPSREILSHLTSRWGVLVLIALLHGTQRFSQLRRKIGGVSERMLAQTLQLLESDGIVERHAYDVVPPHVEYALTPLGKEAAMKVRELADWAESHHTEILSLQNSASVRKRR